MTSPAPRYAVLREIREEEITNSATNKAMLYAAGVPNEDMMKNAPHVGVATVWWEGNACK